MSRTRRPLDSKGITRKQFLFSLGAVASLSRAVAEERTAFGSGKILIVVAHPDDESAFAATVYRYAKELGGIVDHVVITNGEAGYRYSQLAAAYYNANLTSEEIGRSQLPAIRKREAIAAGKILGVRHHYFLDQKDTRFTLDISEPLAAWNTQAIHSFLCSLLKKEQYSFVFTLLPNEETHGHHKAATLLAAQAVESLPAELRPVVLGADPAVSRSPLQSHVTMSGHPEAFIEQGSPVFRFERTTSFGFHNALNYQIVVNWVIAEHKSQGLFQTDTNKYDEERFWILGARSSAADASRTEKLFARLRP